MTMEFRACVCGHDFSMHDMYKGKDKCWFCSCPDFKDKDMASTPTVKKKAKELIEMYEDMKPTLESITERIDRQHRHWTIALYTYWFLVILFGSGFIVSFLIMIYFFLKKK